jgi:uncharacterized protein (TIGR02001 family)
VIARAGLIGGRARGRQPANPLRLALRGGLALLGIATTAPAQAEVGAAVSVFSDARFRGYSLSSGHPVASLDLSFDRSDGTYAAASASVVASTADGLQPLGFQLNGGYARKLSRDVTLDVGITHSNYARYSSRGRANSYTEIYVGATRKFLTTRVYLSPHYFEAGTWTVYGEVDGDVSPARKLHFIGHVGALTPLRRGGDTAPAAFDWRIGVSRELGPVSLQLAWTGVRSAHYHAPGGGRDQSRLIFGLSCPL